MDLRILELQNRLQRKKASNLLLAQAQNQNHIVDQQQQHHHQSTHHLHPNGYHNQQNDRGLKPRPSNNVYPTQRSLMTGPGGHHHGNNVAAVEPFIHQPHKQISPPLPLTKSQSQFISATRSTNKQQQQQQQQFNSQLQQSNNQRQQQILIQNHVQTVMPENLKKGHVASECDDNKLKQLVEEKQQQQQQQQSHTRPSMQTDSLEEDDDGNSSRSSEFSLKKNDPKYQTLPYNTKFAGLATSKSSPNITQLTSSSSSPSSVTSSPPAASAIPAPALGGGPKTNECDSEKIKESTVKQIRQPQSGIKSGIQKPSKLSLNVSSEKLKSPGQIGIMAVPPRKPISSVAPTVTTTTTSATSSSTMIPKIVPKMVQMVAPNNSQTNGSNIPIVDNSPRPALPPKPSSSVSSSSPQSSDTETVQKSASKGSSSLLPPAIVQKSKSSNSIPTIVSVINKQNVASKAAAAEEAKRSAEAMEENIPVTSTVQEPHLPIKAKPLTIKKQPLHEQPKLKASAGAAAAAGSGIAVSSTMKPYLSRRIEMPPSFLFPEIETAELKPPSEEGKARDETDKMAVHTVCEDVSSNSSLHNKSSSISSMSSANSEKNCESKESVARRSRLSNGTQKVKLARRVSFDPLALLLDASLEGELELVRKTATQVPNPSAANDEGITALHNAICAGHLEIVK